MISLVMVVLVLGTVVLGIILSGVGFAPYVSLEALLLIVIAPVAMMLIGVTPRVFFGAFVSAFDPRSADAEDLYIARSVVSRYGRLLPIAAALYATIGLIAMGMGIGPSATDHIWSLGPGVATLLLDLLYVLILEVVLIQPLLARLDRYIITVA